MDNRDSNFDATEADDSDFLARVEQYLQDGLSPAQLASFERELVESGDKRQTFLLVCLGGTFVQEEFGSIDLLSPAGPDGKDAAFNDPSDVLGETMIRPAVLSEPADEEQPLRAPVWTEQRRTNSLRRRFIYGGIAAALAITTTIGALLLFRRGPSDPIATLAQVVNPRWGTPSSLKTADQLVKGQSIVLADGYAELQFLNGTRLVVEGPGQITLDAGNSVRLTEGKVTVRMADGMKGFTVRTPGATVTDLGTEFGVRFVSASNLTDVHVFKGLVSVAPSMSPATMGSVNVAAGDAVQIVGAKPLEIIHGGAKPQIFVRDLGQVQCTLELADLISGGDGLSGLRGGIVDQTNGKAGTIQSTGLGGDLRGDDRYHSVSGLPAVDGCFIPGLSGKPVQVDSAGHQFAFPPTIPRGTVKICAGGRLPQVKQGDVIASVLQGVDYASPSHSFLFIHPSAAITFDLDAIRRLHPNKVLASFQCVVGNPALGNGKQSANAFVLVNGQSRFSKMNVVPQATPINVDIPITASDRFLTLAGTVSGSNVVGHQLIFGDPTLSLVPAPDQDARQTK